MDTRELAWAAGIFEGEGCVHLRRRSGRGQRGTQLLWFGLGSRRRAKAVEVLTEGRPSVGRYPGFRGMHRVTPIEVRELAAWV